MRWIGGFLGLVLLAAEDGYIDPAQCRPCHQTIFDSYKQTGMGRSFQKAERIPPVAGFLHESSGRRYSVVERSGFFFLRRLLPSTPGALEARIDYEIGSGNHSKTYARRDARGRLLELPLSWYAEGEGYWAMSPGYDKADHADFRREVSDTCLFCHNGYPSDANDGLAMGIDCQRCHGPGGQHVKSKGKITNPGKLSRDRQLDVCLQCHLESASRTLPEAIRRFGRTTYSYRPGEPLANYKLFFEFASEEDSPTVRITVNGAGYSLLKSRCFQKSATMTCTTCHDAHAAARGNEAIKRYTTICRTCHASAHNVATSNCTGCHMQKRRTEDAVHVVMTDHLIRRQPLTGDLVAPLKERHDRQTGPVRPLYPSKLPSTAESRLYLALAQLRASGNLARDVARLRDAIAEARPTAAEPYSSLAEAYRKLGQTEAAIGAFRSSIERSKDDVSSYVSLANLLLETNRTGEALVLITNAVKRFHASVQFLNTLSVIHARLKRFDDALDAASKALRIDAEDPISWLNLGVCLHAKGEKKGAEAAYRQAILLQPDLTQARDNLKLLLENQL